MHNGEHTISSSSPSGSCDVHRRGTAAGVPSLNGDISGEHEHTGIRARARHRRAPTVMIIAV